MKLAVLGSGSAGNCLFVHAGRTRLLIDAGLSYVQTKEALDAIGEKFTDIDAVLISHEHSDHVAGLPVMAREWRRRGCQVPIYGGAPEQRFVHIPYDRIGDLMVHTFPIPHDADDPTGFVLEHSGTKFGYAVDLGEITPAVTAALSGCQAILLEANHDPDMLQAGPYEYKLKQRIAGPLGHLANEQAWGYLETSQAELVVLGHLSATANHPELVRRGAAHVLARRPPPNRCKLVVAEPGVPTGVLEI